jgi:hypothetical protein
MLHPVPHATARRAVALAALLLASAACAKKDADNTAAADTTTAGGAVAAPASVSVTDVKLGKAVDANKRVTDETDDFKQADVIYASVVTSGAAPNTNVTARWTFQDGQVVDSTTQVISPSGDAATEFHISKPGGLPKGKYKLEVLVNGTSAETEEFEVK